MAQNPIWKAQANTWMDSNNVNEQSAPQLLVGKLDEVLHSANITMGVAWHLGDADMFSVAHEIRQDAAKLLAHLGNRYGVEL